MIATLLIANRGEVAARIARTCLRLGIDYVTVSVDEDRDLTYHAGAVATVRLPATGGHLDAAALVRAAIETGCDAVHPGYGFLSENADFARAVRSAGLVFVGPSSRVIETMADKASALTVMADAGVPVLPGTREASGDLDALVRAAEDIGYPLIVNRLVAAVARACRWCVPGPSCGSHWHRPPERRQRHSPMVACTWNGTSNTRGTSKCRSSVTNSAVSYTFSIGTAPCSDDTRR